MELDLDGQWADRAYPILASLVTPRPIALVTTISPDGKINAAPFSFFTDDTSAGRRRWRRRLNQE
jgi:hypothetical protein